MSRRAGVRPIAVELARRGVKESAVAVDILRPPPAGIVVLLYHRVGAGTESEVDLPVELFRRQLEELAATADVITLDEAVTRLNGPAESCRGVVLTFDDGTADFVDQAVPLLDRHGLPATLYLATGPVAEGRPFWGDGPALTWPALRDARSTGLVEVGSHTHGHVLLDRTPERVATQELDQSIALIEDELGVTPRHFAYPKAVAPSAASERLVRERFVSAALAGTRPNPRGTDAHRLGRSPIQRSDGLRFFRHKARGGLGLEDRLRDQLNRYRYRGRTT